jgi:hypothetical protein
MMKKFYYSILAAVLFVSFSINSVSAQTVFYLKAGGNITTATDWASGTDGVSGTQLTDFTANRTYDLTPGNNSALSLATTWSITSGSTVNFGDGTAAFNFTLATGGLIGNSGAPRVNFLNQTTMVLQEVDNFGFGSTKTDFRVGSTIVYASGSENPIDDFSDPFHHLVISSTHSISGAIDVAGNLTLNSSLDLNTGQVNLTGNLVMGANLIFTGGALNVGGTISGAGLFVGDANGSSLSLSGTGSIGTLNFSSGNEKLSHLTVALGSANSTVTLGQDLAIDGGVLTLTSGNLKLDTWRLDILSTGSIDFAGGSIIGDNSASIDFSGAITGSMLMNTSANNLAYVVLNSSGNTLTIGNTLNIIDSISAHSGTLNANSNLVINSSSSLKGRLGLVGKSGSTAAVTGNMTVRTLIPGQLTDWAQLGVSGVNGQTVANWDTYVSSGGTTGVPMMCENCSYGVTATGYYFESIQGWEEPANSYDTTITANTALTPGRGFWVYVGDGPSTTNDLTLVNFGTAVTGNVSRTITAAATTGTDVGMNLVANPYASPISADRMFNANGGIAGTLYSYSAEFGESSYSMGAGQGGFNNNGELAMGQGFYVQALADPVTITFTEAMKVGGGNNPEILRPASSSSNIGKIFRLKIKGSGLDKDDAVIRIHPNATASFDYSMDAKKLFHSPGYAGYTGPYSKYTSISTKDPAGKDYAIHSVPALTQSLSMPVLARAMVTGPYTITATEFDDVENCIILFDKQTGIYHDLKLAPLVVTLNDTVQTPRFELIMCEDANTTDISKITASKEIFIHQDADGPFVTTQFEKPTKATISMFNIIGQQLAEDINVEGTTTVTRLNPGVHNQVVLIRVTTERETVVKKMIAH